MGMSGYILDLEEQFDTKVEEAVEQSECVEEAVAEAMKHRGLVAHMTDAEVVDYVHEGWQEFWSKYENDGQPDWAQEWEDFGECYE